MRVITDDIIFHLQRNGGISRIYRESWPRMLDLDPTLAIDVLTNDGPPSIPLLPRLVPRPALPILLDRAMRPIKLTWPVRVEMSALLTRRGFGEPTQAQPTEARASVWHSTYYSAPLAWRGSTVVMFYDLVHERHPELFSRLRGSIMRHQKRRAALGADHIICISRSTQRDVIEFYGVAPERTTVVHLAADPAFSEERPQGHRSVSAPLEIARLPERFVLFIGSRTAYKNFHRVLRALESHRALGDVSLVAVGAPWTDDERAETGRMGLDGRIVQLPWADDDLLVELYRRAAVFVYPSLYEGFGIPLVEAMASGCPVVASDIPSSREVAGDVPIYFSVDDTTGIAEALVQALREGRPSDRTRAGRAQAAGYSWEQTALGMLDVYRTVLAR